MISAPTVGKRESARRPLPSPGLRETPGDTAPGGGGKSPYRPCGTLPRRGRQGRPRRPPPSPGGRDTPGDTSPGGGGKGTRRPLPSPGLRRAASPLGRGTTGDTPKTPGGGGKSGRGGPHRHPAGVTRRATPPPEGEARALCGFDGAAPTVTASRGIGGDTSPGGGGKGTRSPLPSTGLRRAASPLGRETPGDTPKTPGGEARAPTAPAGHSPGGGGKSAVRICRGRCNRFARMRCI